MTIIGTNFDKQFFFIFIEILSIPTIVYLAIKFARLFKEYDMTILECILSWFMFAFIAIIAHFHLLCFAGIVALIATIGMIQFMIIMIKLKQINLLLKHNFLWIDFSKYRKHI